MIINSNKLNKFNHSFAKPILLVGIVSYLSDLTYSSNVWIFLLVLRPTKYFARTCMGTTPNDENLQNIVLCSAPTVFEKEGNVMYCL